jgi:hypothetical protein
MASQGFYSMKNIQQTHLYHRRFCDCCLYLEDGVKATLEELHTGVSKHSVEGVR